MREIIIIMRSFRSLSLSVSALSHSYDDERVTVCSQPTLISIAWCSRCIPIICEHCQ